MDLSGDHSNDWKEETLYKFEMPRVEESSKA